MHTPNGSTTPSHACCSGATPILGLMVSNTDQAVGLCLDIYSQQPEFILQVVS